MIPGQPSPMETDSSFLADRTWAKTTAICGIAAIVSYGLLITLPGPAALQVLLMFGFGLYFSVAAPAAPRVGLVAAVSNTVAAFGWTGMGLAAALLALNIATFPVPPGNAGLVDLGPAVALWYVAVSIQLMRLLLRPGGPASA